MKRLPADRLPKGTRLDLLVLLKRCLALDAAQVRMPMHSIRALQRVIAYLDANPIEGGADAKAVGPQETRS